MQNALEVKLFKGAQRQVVYQDSSLIGIYGYALMRGQSTDTLPPPPPPHHLNLIIMKKEGWNVLTKKHMDGDNNIIT